MLSVLIVLAGGVVRVTASGLGCPTWPACEVGSLAPTPELGIHGVIEFANRLFTGVLIFAVGWAIVAARLQKPRNRGLTRLAWSQFWLVVANAVAGGLSVLAGLNPYVVALHFTLAIALLTTTTLTWHRARQPITSPPSPSRPARALAWAVTILTLALILVGTLVTGSGPHSGDSAEVHRMSFNWEHVTIVHAVLGSLTVILALALWVVLRGDAAGRLARRRVGFFIVVVILQGAVGTVQALTSLPAALVAIHLLGAALVWIGALRVLLDTNPGLFRGRPVERAAVPVNTVGAR
ncbi:COX15/CtaA family protein [Lacisediminihabitans changchengi]|uniref:COX15/CtaA family protein n=1 Tax=Lacisediminihabitans changchengi TaxID=2787634 RepID=A0A934W479_9MICO|nr:COX15/CtaA family protein [Lacisediminihabitans changchengi]MBK4346858.1 COX15/CtaA family protein [Lacisediminihabitans changchengi]MBK4348019.1 COX15/CtaA family protein [Lacisediminihabitans changchengi]